MAVVLISILTGSTLVKYQGIVSRADDPKTFWGALSFIACLDLSALDCTCIRPTEFQTEALPNRCSSWPSG